MPGNLLPSQGTAAATRGAPRCARTKTAMLKTTPDMLPGMPSQPTNKSVFRLLKRVQMVRNNQDWLLLQGRGRALGEKKHLG